MQMYASCSFFCLLQVEKLFESPGYTISAAEAALEGVSQFMCLGLSLKKHQVLAFLVYMQSVWTYQDMAGALFRFRSSRLPLRGIFWPRLTEWNWVCGLHCLFGFLSLDDWNLYFGLIVLYKVMNMRFLTLFAKTLSLVPQITENGCPLLPHFFLLPYIYVYLKHSASIFRELVDTLRNRKITIISLINREGLKF